MSSVRSDGELRYKRAMLKSVENSQLMHLIEDCEKLFAPFQQKSGFYDLDSQNRSVEKIDQIIKKIEALKNELLREQLQLEDDMRTLLFDFLNDSERDLKEVLEHVDFGKKKELVDAFLEHFRIFSDALNGFLYSLRKFVNPSHEQKHIVAVSDMKSEKPRAEKELTVEQKEAIQLREKAAQAAHARKIKEVVRKIANGGTFAPAPRKLTAEQQARLEKTSQAAEFRAKQDVLSFADEVIAEIDKDIKRLETKKSIFFFRASSKPKKQALNDLKEMIRNAENGKKLGDILQGWKGKLISDKNRKNEMVTMMEVVNTQRNRFSFFSRSKTETAKTIAKLDKHGHRVIAKK